MALASAYALDYLSTKEYYIKYKDGITAIPWFFYADEFLKVLCKVLYWVNAGSACK